MLKFIQPELVQYIAILHPHRLIKFQTPKGIPFPESSLMRLMHISHFLAIKEGDQKYEILKDWRAAASEKGNLVSLELMEAYAEDLGIVGEVEWS